MEQHPQDLQAQAQIGKKSDGNWKHIVVSIVICALIFTPTGVIAALRFSESEVGEPSAHGIAQGNYAPSGEPLSASDIYERVAPAVVSIVVERTYASRNEPVTVKGSGVIITKDGYIVTNFHVIERADSITVVLPTGHQYAAQLTGGDFQSDLAVLNITGDNFAHVILGDSDILKVGEPVFAIGDPLDGLRGSITQGIISQKDRVVPIDETKRTLLQTDASLNHGNSGGALCNQFGELIGIVNAKNSAMGVEGVGFAIPISDAKPIIDELILNGYASPRTTLGITLKEVTPQNAAFFCMEPGVYAAELDDDGPAVRAGMCAGDRIVSINGAAVNSVADFKAIQRAHSAGDKLTMKIERYGTPMEITVILEILQ